MNTFPFLKASIISQHFISLPLPFQMWDSGASRPGHLTGLLFSRNRRDRSRDGSSCTGCREGTVQAHRHLQGFHAPMQTRKFGIHMSFLGDAEATHELQALGEASRVNVKDRCRTGCEAWCKVGTYAHWSRVRLLKLATMHLMVELSRGGKVQTVGVHFVQVGQRRRFHIALGSWPAENKTVKG